MKTFLHRSASLLLLLCSMAAGLAAVEAAGFSLFGVRFRFLEFLTALAAGFGAALVYSLAAGAIASRIPQVEPHLQRFTSLTASLALLYIILVLWLRGFAFTGSTPRVLTILALLLLLGLFIGLGRMLWFYFTRVSEDLAEARFAALAPVSTVCAGLYSVAFSACSDKTRLGMSVLGILVLFMAGQYLGIRFLWGRKRKRLARLRVRFQLAVIIIATAAAAGGAAIEHAREYRPASAPPGAPPVLLISVDTLRADYLHANREQMPPTPAMDSLARDGVNFKNAMAAGSWTTPSVAAFITGLFPSAVGAGEVIPAPRRGLDYTGPLSRALTLAEAFAEAGYVTAGFVDNPWISWSRGYGQGFRWFELMGDPELRPRFLAARALEQLYRPLFPWAPHPAGRLTNRALKWLRHRPPGPFFLWLHYIDPHTPYEPHHRFPTTAKPTEIAEAIAQYKIMKPRTEIYAASPQEQEFVRQRYEGEVRYTDLELERLLAWLKNNGLYEKSLICFTSDHGEEFWEHGSFAHGQSYHREVMNVPLIIKFPENRYAGRVVDDFVNNNRLGKTLLEIAGIKNSYPGPSLLPCLSGDCPEDPELGPWWFSERTLFGKQLGTVGDQKGRVKAILYVDGRVLCYDLKKDPLEQNPLTGPDCTWIPGEPSPLEIFRSFRKHNLEIFKKLGGEEERRKAASGYELRKLRDLGYIQ